jgi:hypothetical protein
MEDVMSDETPVPQVIKVWWKDATLWTNVVAIVALILNNQFGFKITPEIQASILGLLNVILKIPKMATTEASAKARNARALASMRG